MDNHNSLGQGINALIPPKKDLSNQPENLLGDRFSDSKFEEVNDGALEEKITEKINNAFGDFPQEIASPFNSIKENFQADFQGNIQPPSFTENLAKSDTLEDSEIALPKSEEIEKSLLEEKIFYIEVEKIKPNPQQPRRTFPEETIQELANSIREYGILEPLIVSRVEKDTATGTEVEYELIAGERRLLAAKRSGLTTVPAIIRKPVEEQKKLELALIENIQREDLTPIAKARAFARLIDEFGLTQQSLAERIGKSRESIANALRLLQLSVEAQKALEEGRINEGHARAILLFNNAEKRRVFLREILARNLSGRESIELAQHYLRLNQKQAPETRRRNVYLDPEDLELKEKLENLLGTPVLIKKKGDQGAIEIKFYSRQDLDKILNKIFPL
ncbi:MAG: ParB/RepB/Spo0J family partition protein [Candidatus Pacebacteria bacterium]|nr:ParB/RepB/Spo0J family partition protein [Candidatus Paceibacterota bacterium]